MQLQTESIRVMYQGWYKVLMACERGAAWERVANPSVINANLIDWFKYTVSM